MLLKIPPKNQGYQVQMYLHGTETSTKVVRKNVNLSDQNDAYILLITVLIPRSCQDFMYEQYFLISLI